VAAADAVDRVVPVAPATTRGADALQRLRDRLADVGADAGPSLAVQRSSAEADAPTASFDASLPRTDETAVAAAPTSLDDEAFAAAVADAAETVLDCSVDLTFDRPGLVSRVREDAADGLLAFRDR
jgi:hypothetical protein